MTAEGVRSHSSTKKTSSSSSSEQNATVLRPPPPQADDPLSLTMEGEERPESHGLLAVLSSGVMGGVYLRQLLRPRRERMVVEASSDMAAGTGGCLAPGRLAAKRDVGEEGRGTGREEHEGAWRGAL